jgi:putative sigma-54 modulation protein
MQLSITGKNLEITDSLKQYVEKKIGRLDRYLPNNILEGRVELAVESTRAAKDSQVAQVTLRTKRTVLRAEESSADMFASIDAVFDKMQRQIDRFKGKKRTAKRGTEGIAEVATVATATAVAEEEETAEETRPISRVKRFAMVPMDEEEAVEQMELLGHDFYVFYNANQSQINVVYRRKDGSYGLIQPDVA